MDTYEKKYKEALERARNLRKDAIDMGENLRAKECEIIFPELKESEDEKIRKELISLVENWKIFNPNSPFDEHPVYTSDKDTVDKILAWLEKQGEYANFRNKIQVGDKVTRNRDGVLVNLSQLKRVANPSEKQGEQNPAWSEEDELKIKEIEEAYTNYCHGYTQDTILDWLKSLKQRIGG